MHTKLQPLLARNRGRGGHRGSLLTKKHPWYSGYAIPQNVWDEHDGAVISRGLPRRAGGEPRNVFVSPGLPRGTIMQRMPSQFVTSSLGGSSLGCCDEGSYGSLGWWGGDAVRAIGRGIKKGAKFVGKGVGSLACSMSDAGLLDKALGAAGGAAGGAGGSLVAPGVGSAVGTAGGAKAGIAAANAIAKKCGRPPISRAAVEERFGPAVAASYNPGGIRPIHLAIGGAALVGLFLVLK